MLAEADGCLHGVFPGTRSAHGRLIAADDRILFAQDYEVTRRGDLRGKGVTFACRWDDVEAFTVDGGNLWLHLRGVVDGVCDISLDGGPDWGNWRGVCEQRGLSQMWISA